MTRPIVQWILAAVLTTGAAVYQRITGPTYPLTVRSSVNGQEHSFRLTRSGETGKDETVMLSTGDERVWGELLWKRFPTSDEWSRVLFKKVGGTLFAELPTQPPAGKLAYRIVLHDTLGTKELPMHGPVVMRFKGAVPMTILIVHVMVMFAAMFFSTKTALLAFGNGKHLMEWTLVTTGLLFVGGLILGPIVQKFAFGAFWTGWPFGHDLTDNKTLIAFIAWATSLLSFRRATHHSRWVIGAAVVTLIVFLIPHSLLGSEFDYSAMQGR